MFLLVYFNSLKMLLKKMCLPYGISTATDAKELNFKMLVGRKVLVSKMEASGENRSLVVFCFSPENRLRILVFLQRNVGNM